MIQSQCQQVNFAYLVCEALFWWLYHPLYLYAHAVAKSEKNVECTPTPLLIIINDSFSEIYFYGTIILKNISNILNLFISQSVQQRGTLHFSQNLTSVEVLSLRLCRYLYFRRNCRILIRQQQSQGVVPPYFLPCMEKRHEWMDSIWPAAP